VWWDVGDRHFMVFQCFKEISADDFGGVGAFLLKHVAWVSVDISLKVSAAPLLVIFKKLLICPQLEMLY